MTSPITTFCDGGNCPSKTNCKRYVAPRPQDFNRAALWVRREDGSNACELVIWVNLVTTFKEPEYTEEERCSYPQCTCPFDAPADPNWCARGLAHKN